MAKGQFILDRWMVSMIRDICDEQGISFKSYSDDWLLELTCDDRTSRVFGYKFDLNGSVSSSIAGDKVAAYQILKSHSVPAVEHRLIQTKAGIYDTWSKDFGSIVIKPLDGTSGHGVRLLSAMHEADDYIDSRPAISSWAASPYVNITSERRFILLDGTVICTYEKQPITIDGLKMFNLGLGAKAIVSAATEESKELAVGAISALGLRLAAVDIITVDGKYKVLEVNDGIMMENFMRQSSQCKQIGQHVYERIILAMFA